MEKVQEQLKKVNGEREEDAVQIQEYNVSRGGPYNIQFYGEISPGVDLRNNTVLW